MVAKEIQLLQQLKQTVEIHIDDEFFKAPELSKAMAMSQTQLYRKIKGLTNTSTAKYIKTIRLERAKHLLLRTDLRIGQIAVEVGYKTQAHFTRSFQEEFGVLPSFVRR